MDILWETQFIRVAYSCWFFFTEIGIYSSLWSQHSHKKTEARAHPVQCFVSDSQKIIPTAQLAGLLWQSKHQGARRKHSWFKGRIWTMDLTEGDQYKTPSSSHIHFFSSNCTHCQYSSLKAERRIPFFLLTSFWILDRCLLENFYHTFTKYGWTQF